MIVLQKTYDKLEKEYNDLDSKISELENKLDESLLWKSKLILEVCKLGPSITKQELLGLINNI